MMRREQFLSIIIAISVAVLGSCNRDSETVGVGGVGIKLTATADFPAAAGTRVSVDNGTGAVSWSAGDAIALFDNHSTTNSSFALQSAGGTNATFSGLIKTGGALADRVFYAIYPYGAGTFAGTTCTLDLPAEQSGNVANYLYMVADPLPFSGDPVTQNITLNFRQLMALVDMNISNVPAGESVVKVQLTTALPSVRPFVVKGNIDIAAGTGGNPAISPIAFSSYIQTNIVAATGATSAKASLALFPVDFSLSPTDLQVVVTTTDGSYDYDYTVAKPTFNQTFSRRSQNTTAVDLTTAAKSLPYAPPKTVNWNLTTTVITVANVSTAEYVFMASLQGVVAKTMPGIYILPNNSSTNSYAFWLERLKEAGFTSTTKSFADTRDQFLSYAKGYVLVNEDLSNVTVGATVAGVLGAVILTPSLAAQAPYNSLPMLADLTGKDETWLYDYVVANRDKFDLNGILQPTFGSPWALVDWGIERGMVTIYCGGDTTLCRKFYNFVGPDNPRYGWGSPFNAEGKDVSFGAQSGLFTVAANLARNLSILSTEQIKPITRTPPAITVPTQKNVHYLAIIMSDGDNLNYWLSNYIGNDRFLDPGAQGQKLTWSMPPTLRTVCPVVFNWMMGHIPDGNYIIGGFSGAGYTHIGEMKDQSDYMRRSNDMMKACGLEYFLSRENVPLKGANSEQTIMNEALNNELKDMKGVVYDNMGALAYPGDYFFVGDKPVVSFRFRWRDDGTAGTSYDEIMTALGSASRDVTKGDAYSIMLCTLGTGKGVAEADRFISNLPADVQVVTVGELMELMRTNIPH